MRKILILVAGLLVFTDAAAQRRPKSSREKADTACMQSLAGRVQGGAHLHFLNTAHDFGDIPRRGGDLVKEFVFVNDGTEPLVILHAITSCTCTKGTFPKKPVAPGGSGTVTITYDPAQQKGVFFKAIQVYSNGEQRRLIVTVKGEVY